MKLIKQFIVAVNLVLFFSLGHAEVVSFKTVWTKINEASPSQEASRLALKSSQEAQARLSRHWLPKVYVDAKGYRTNDPGASFFGLLQQRSLEAGDFNPDSINHPQARTFVRGAFGLDLPIYEGGAKSAEVDMYIHEVNAHKIGVQQSQVDLYSQVSSIYGTSAVLIRQKQKLQKLSADLNSLLSRYQLGDKSNPVGYSGLLGMKSLSLRLQSHLNQVTATTNAQFMAIQEMGFTKGAWEPEPVDPEKFVQTYLGNVNGKTRSYRLSAAEERVRASELAAKMERARLLPRVGAFAESFVFSGNRDTADGYSAGVYLQWNIFGPSDYGRISEARIKSAAAAKAFEATEQQENAERAALDENLRALKANIKLLRESDGVLTEQAAVATKLFRNGSISALQIVEVLNRRTDLVIQQAEAEMNYIQLASQAVLRESFQIPELTKGEN